MVSNPHSGRNSRLVSSLFAGLAIAGMVFVAGCPDAVQPPDDGGEPPGQTAARIISPVSSFGISMLDQAISVIYTVPAAATAVSGYYVPVEGSAPNSPPAGTPVVVVEGLPSGENRVFNFNPQESGVGYFRVGVNYTLNGQQLFVESQGVIQVQGSPSPEFLLPDQAETAVEQGEDVLISFDAGDPEGVVAWRLFHLGDGDSDSAPPDRLGTQLSTGTGNSGTFRLNTSGLALGLYRLGLSATDSGFSIGATVNRGETERIVTIPNDNVSTPMIRVVAPDVLQPPTLAVTAPAAGGVTLFRDDPFEIKFAGQTFETGGDRSIEVFRDNDNNFANGVTIIEDDLPISTTKLALPTNLPEGTYFIGATIRDGITQPLTVYAAGQVRVVRNVTLNVSQPTSPLPVPPGTTVSIAWSTNAPPSAGTVDAFAQVADNDGNGTGDEIPIVTDAPLTTTSAQFTSADPGRFKITVRVNVRDETKVTASAPSLVRFSSLPGIIWLGSLADPEGDIEGAIFGGANFEDNAGSSFAAAGDLDGDGADEMVIASRYGKPFFVNPSGIGPGEAYIVYGVAGAGKLRGELNLNSTAAPGSGGFRGLTLTGISSFEDDEGTLDTDGLADIESVPDSDGDGKNELLFGFPRANSISHDFFSLERSGQFLNGGVVFLASTETSLSSPQNTDGVIDLWLVGQQFTDETIVPDPNTLFADTQEFQEADPDNDVEAGCVDGGDEVLDTTLGPSIGFVPLLAFSAIEQVWFFDTDPSNDVVIHFPPAEEGELLCHTEFDPGICLATTRIGIRQGIEETLSGFIPGSGFYPANTQAIEPFGARLIGLTEDEKFGTSITFSRSGNAQNSTELIISAPGRTLQEDAPPAGVAYMMDNRALWEPFLGLPPPHPHQYLAGFPGYCGGGRTFNPDNYYFVGDQTDKVQIILGVDDINNDARGDVAIGAPDANTGNGRVYIAFRRELSVESDYELADLGRHPQDPERLTGLLLTSLNKKNLGFSLASGFDFNDDGHNDIVIGAPVADNEVGEVYILFGGSGLVTGEDGENIEDLLASRTRTGGPVVARIKGNPSDQGLFGFNVANGGDIDGDGTNDLLIAAPQAAPRFDPNPNDSVDELTRLGIDMDADGVADDVPGDNRLLNAGLVYVIYGKNRLDQMLLCANSGKPCADAEDCAVGESCSNKNFTISVRQLGTTALEGFMISGRREGDRLGGGDAGEVNDGGIAAKNNRGRSFGLSTAGDVDGDGRADILIGSILADPRRDPTTQQGIQNGGEAYLIYGTAAP